MACKRLSFKCQHSDSCIHSLFVASVDACGGDPNGQILIHWCLSVWVFIGFILKLMFLQGSVMAVEFLLLNGAKINAQDADGKTPLHLATELGKNIFCFILPEL